MNATLCCTALLLCAGLTAGWSPYPTAARVADTTGRGHALTQTLHQVVEAYAIPGAAAAVLFPDGTMWQGASGRADAARPATPAAVFESGSITKTFTAALVLQLASEGALSLDDSLARWVPGVPGAAGVTLRQLLNHTSGLYNPSEHSGHLSAVLEDPGRVWTLEDHYAFLDAPYFAPGEGYHYSNLNYVLLGHLAEQASGARMADELRRRFFEPLELEHTFFEAQEAVTAERAHGFIDVDGDGMPEDITSLMPNTSMITSAHAAGAIVTNAGDLVRWAQALYGGEVVQDRWFDEMMTFVDRGDGTGYGLGTVRVPYDGFTLFGHCGNTGGYSAAVWHVPEAEITVALLTNAHLLDALPPSLALLDTALGRQPRLPTREAASPGPDAPAMGNAADHAEQGERYLDAGRPQKAIGHFEQAVALALENAHYRARLGTAHFAAAEANAGARISFVMQGKQAYEEALRLEPHNLEAHLGLIQFYLHAPRIAGGDMQKAIEHAESIRAFDAVRGLLELEAIYAAQRDWEAARTVYVELMDQPPPAGHRTVALTLAHAEAESVAVAGSFNGWTPYPLYPDDGVWRRTVYLAPGEHQYRFRVDGDWVLDPENPRMSEQGAPASILLVE